MKRYKIVEAFGITVVPVPTLKDSVCLVSDQRVALVRPDLDDETHQWCLDWLIQQAASLESVTS